MEDFPFNFNLSYKNDNYIVKPPPNLFKLKELASKKYEVAIEEMAFIPENEDEMIINNEQNYADLIQYASDHNLTEVVIIINREKEKKGKNEGKGEKDGQNEEKKKKFKKRRRKTTIIC